MLLATYPSTSCWATVKRPYGACSPSTVKRCPPILSRIPQGPKLLAAIDSLGDARAVTLLNAVASAHARNEGPTLEWSAELGRALCAEFELAPALVRQKLAAMWVEAGLGDLPASGPESPNDAKEG